MDSVKMFSAFFDESLTAVEVTPDIRNDYLYPVSLFFELDVLEKVILCDATVPYFEPDEFVKQIVALVIAAVVGAVTGKFTN